MHTPQYWTQQFSRGDLRRITQDGTMTYEECMNEVYDFISQSSVSANAEEDQTYEQKMESLKQSILLFVTDKKPMVEGYINRETGKIEYERLSINLIESITSYDILTQAMADPSITEIRINGLKAIWVERKGRAQLLTDTITGERVYFKSVDDCVKMINKLLRFSNAKFGKDAAIANGITVEGFRVAATHQVCSAADKGTGQSQDKSPYCVIRKFSDNKFTFKDLVRFKSIGTEMANMFTILPQADATILVVGATGSGKTVLVQGLVDRIPGERRLVIIENPSELRARLYDNEGFMLNDVIQWEAKDPPPGSDVPSSFPTYSNLMIEALRMSPHYFVFGELRSDLEFNLALTAANTGHHFLTTYHAPSAADAIDRYVIAVMGASASLPREIVLSRVCQNIDFVLVQEKLNDGNRKVMEVAEVVGTEIVDGILGPKLNMIYVWEPSPDGIQINPETGKEYIPGEHYLVGEISAPMTKRLRKAGLTKEQLDMVCRHLGDDGKPILCTYNPDGVIV